MAYPFAQRVQMAQARHVERPAAAVLGRMTAIGSSFPDRLGDHGSGVDDDAIGDVEVSHDGDSTADHAVLAYARAAGDTGAAGDRRVRTDMHVVPDLDQIVELDTVLDDGVIQRTAVYASVGADFDVVTDQHPAYLRDLAPDAMVLRDAEAVGPNHRAGVHQRTLAEAAPRINGDARMQAAGGADLDPIAEVAARADHHAPAQLDPAADVGAGADAGTGRNHGAALDYRGPVHPGLDCLRRVEQSRDLGEVKVGIIADYARQLGEAAVCSAQYDRAGACTGKLLAVFALSEKADVLSAGALQRRNLADRRLRVAEDFTTKAFDDLGQAVFLGLSHRRWLLPCRLVFQCLNHLFSDVDARAGVDRFLEDDVVFLRLGNGLDGAIGALEHRGQFLVAPLVEILAEF